MLYEEYQKKIAKRAAFFNVLYRFRVLLILGAAFTVVSAGTLVGVGGIVLEGSEAIDTVAYGDEIPYSASAVYGKKVSYEFKPLEGDSWGKAAPYLPGSYALRAKAENNFGGYYYGAVHTFKIVPKEVELAITPSALTYGEIPNLSYTLAYEDKLLSYQIHYDDISKETPLASADLSSLKVVDAAGQDRNACYSFKAKESPLTLTSRALTISLPSITKTYDGQVLASSDYSLDGGSLAPGDDLQLSFTQSLTGVGATKNLPKAVVKTAGGVDVTSHYSFHYNGGDFTVQKRPLTVTTASFSREYDGTPIADETYTITAGDLAANETLKLTYSSASSLVGTYPNNAVAQVFDASGKETTTNYDLSVIPGELQVKPRLLTIRSNDAEKEYDGTALSNQTFTVVEGSLAPHETLNLSFDGTQQNAGTGPNTWTVRIAGADGNETTANYALTIDVGNLVITPRPLTFQSNDSTKVYDGTPLSEDLYTLISGSLAEGDNAAASFKNTLTKVGSVPNDFSVVITNSKNEDVTSNYNITYAPGTLSVTARPLTIEGMSASKTFDGTPLIAGGCFIGSGTSLAPGDTLETKDTGSQTEVGTIQSRLLGTVNNAGGEDVTFCYDITVIPHTLTVTSIPLTVAPKDLEKIYDGTPLVPDNTYTVLSGALYGKDSLTLTTSGSQTTVGTSTSTITSCIAKDETGNDVSSRYNFTFQTGKLQVALYPLTVLANSASKVYDDTPLTASGYTFISGQLAAGESVTSVTYGGESLTEVTTDPLATTIKAITIGNSLGQDTTGNYLITYKSGTLTVLPRPISVVGQHIDYEYDGTAHACPGFTYDTTALLPGHEIRYSFTGSFVHAGEQEGIPEVHIYRTSDGVNLDANYKINLTRPSATGTKRPLTIHTESASKEYDGSWLFPVSGKYTISGGTSLAPTDTITEVTCGGSPYAGQYPNSIEIRSITNSNYGEVVNDYAITGDFGTLTITKRPITVQTPDLTKVYDGTPLAVPNDGLTITSGSLLPGESLFFLSDANITNVGTTPNIGRVQVRDSSGSDLPSDSYDITLEYGTLSVTPCPLTLTPYPESKVYDGTVFSGTIPLAGVGLPSGFSASGFVTSTSALVGSSISTTITGAQTILDSNGQNVDLSNFTISFSSGTAAITARPLTIATLSGTKIYDGAPFLNRFWIARGSLAKNEQIAYTNKTSYIEIGDYSNALPTITITNSNGDDVTSCYEITGKLGTIHIIADPEA
jgi:hypothetical protein